MRVGEGLRPTRDALRVAFDGAILVVGGRRHGRGARLGETLPQPDARAERNRNPAAV